MSAPIPTPTFAVNVRALAITSGPSSIQYSPFTLLLNEAKPSCVVIGASGCGKTTFFRSLIERFRTEWSEYGRTVIDVDAEVNGLSVVEHPRLVGYAPQRPFVIPHLDVRANVVAPFRWRGTESPDESKVDGILDLFCLKPIAHRSAYQLSSGELQRLNLARMFLLEPKVAILDECLSALDEELAAEISSNIVKHYLPTCRVLISSHRYSDRQPFQATTVSFSYVDRLDRNNRKREVTAHVC